MYKIVAGVSSISMSWKVLCGKCWCYFEKWNDNPIIQVYPGRVKTKIIWLIPYVMVSYTLGISNLDITLYRCTISAIHIVHPHANQKTFGDFEREANMITTYCLSILFCRAIDSGYQMLWIWGSNRDYYGLYVS
jgi:hypothetical protein